jgi:hypothetical protein
VALRQYFCSALLKTMGSTDSLLLNPTNAAVTATAVKQQTYIAKTHFVGEAELHKDQQQPFRISSGQRNVGCGDLAPASVRLVLPAGAVPVGEPCATWENTSNLSAASIGRVAVDPQSNTVYTEGSVRGLPFQSLLFGIRNCPGGGHGELVLQGTYKSTVTEREPREVTLESTMGGPPRAGSLSNPQPEA